MISQTGWDFRWSNTPISHLDHRSNRLKLIINNSKEACDKEACLQPCSRGPLSGVRERTLGTRLACLLVDLFVTILSLNLFTSKKAYKPYGCTPLFRVFEFYSFNLTRLVIAVDRINKTHHESLRNHWNPRHKSGAFQQQKFRKARKVL